MIIILLQMVFAYELIAIVSGLIFTSWFLIMVITKKMDPRTFKNVKLKDDPPKPSFSMQPTPAPKSRRLSQSIQSFSDLGLLYNGDLEMFEHSEKSDNYHMLTINSNYDTNINFDIPDERKAYHCQRCGAYVNITNCTMHKHSMWVCHNCYYK